MEADRFDNLQRLIILIF